MNFSVILITKNRELLLQKAIQAILSQDYPHSEFELIVVDNAQSHACEDLIDSIKQTTDISITYTSILSPPSCAIPRNQGLKLAKGNWVAFTDDDATAETQWLKAADDVIHANPRAVGVEGSVSTDHYGQFWHSVQHIPTSNKEMPQWMNFVGANQIWKRDIVGKIGMYDEKFPGPWREDTDMAIRMSKEGKIVPAPEARIFHAARRIGVREALNRERRHICDAYLYSKWPEEYLRLFPRANVIWLALILLELCWIPFLILLVLTQDPLWYVFGIPAMFGGAGFHPGWFFWPALVSVILGFIAGKGLKGAILRLFGPYLRFYSYSRGARLLHVTFPWLKLIVLKILK
jgi:glycosyltransferase involved in cell wall biosynthesis